MNTTTVIPKAKLATCERWQPDTFDSADAQSEAAANKAKNGTTQHNEQAADTLKKNEVQLQQALENARQQGYESGYKKGFEAGQNDGYQESRQQGESEIKIELDQVSAIITNLDQQILSIEQQIAQDILTFAIDLTKKMITQALTIHPELILPIVQEAAAHLPGTDSHLLIFLNPEDAKIVRHYQNDQSPQENWKIYEDTQLERGGCRLQTNGGSEIDGSIETRWRHVLASIGQKNDWVEK